MKKILSLVCVALLACLVSACSKEDKTIKIGVSFGVGEAARWPQELAFMEKRADELGVNIETRLNKTDTPKTQEEDCKELVDSGIDVLIVTPRNINETGTIVEYAKENGVKVISYARLIREKEIDLFVGYDTYLIGKDLGKYAIEEVYAGDYIILKGDQNDFNTTYIYDGMMKYIEPLKGDITIITDEYVNNWDTDIAKQIVKEAVIANGNKVDAVLAPNDKLAKASIEVLEELQISVPVLVSGMDAELDALQRVVQGKQSCTVYMNLESLANAAVDKAVSLVKGEGNLANTEQNNGSKNSIKSYLLNGKLVTKQNLDTIIIDGNVFTKEQIYGE